ncbi:MAG: hypothetical protein QNJ68_03820 [Microcoleaceae cyanobacterium MO_207.B10]|nr:hypothetical protein [Microcoleaceae cyanobacterium MO_207.B10]
MLILVIPFIKNFAIFDRAGGEGSVGGVGGVGSKEKYKEQIVIVKKNVEFY